MAKVEVEALNEAAKKSLEDASRFLFFDDNGTVLGSSFQVWAAQPSCQVCTWIATHHELCCSPT